MIYKKVEKIFKKYKIKNHPLILKFIIEVKLLNILNLHGKLMTGFRSLLSAGNQKQKSMHQSALYTA